MLRLLNIDNYWFDIKIFCFIYGFRGINYYEIKIFGFDRDFYFGVFGGIVYELMMDFIVFSK